MPAKHKQLQPGKASGKTSGCLQSPLIASNSLMDVGEGDYEAEENKFMLPKLTGPHTLKHSLPRALVRASFRGGRRWI